MNQHQYKNLTIEVNDDPTYKYGSADNNFNYSKHHFGDDAQDYPTSNHGVKVFGGEQIIESCIVIGSGGATGIQKGSSLIDNDQIVICCCDTIFCLRIPDLKLKWKTKTDQATCFQIYKLQNDYIVHGEITISRLDKAGNIKWQFGGSDIFVSFDNEEAFKLNLDNIELTDFYNIKYKINFDGEVIWSSKKHK